MKKIGIFTWFNIENYGTAFQALSLYKYLSSKYDVSLVSYFDFRRFKKISYRLNLLAKNMLSFPLNIRKFVKSGNIIKGIKINATYKNVKILSVYSKKQIKMIDNFDILVTGSDQIWNPYYLDDFYLLAFSENKNKISYSSSVGVAEIPAPLKNRYIDALSKFSYIAVREKNGELILKELLKRQDICTVLDPVFLFSKNEWTDFYKRKTARLAKKESPNENCIFCYFIGDKKEYKTYVDEISTKIGIKSIIYIPSTENKRIILDGKRICTAGLEEFLFYLANAQLVITDSFHATAFSLILKKQFIEFVRFDKKDSKSQNSRIYNLLERYGLQDRIYEGKDMPKSKIDYSICEQKLKSDVTFSKKYLEKAIGGEM